MPITEPAGDHIELRNTLGSAASAYLRSAAHQPIAWQQWGPEAFDLARRLDRPVLLDIGAVWCHWCHVMDHESYEDTGVARLVNEHFIAIKVDRDERPDVDTRYQRLVQALSQQGGGWPLTAFLTPAGHVFSGGTYFPRTDRYGRPGLLTLLPRVAEVYRQNGLGAQEEVVEVNRQILEATGDRLTPGEPSEQWLHTLLATITHEWEETHAGFGLPSGPKFPAPGTVELLLRLHAEIGRGEARDMALSLLRAMARGGIHDQLAGGFHRYSVDGMWRVPHFEKMLYDNAGLLANFAHAFAETGDGEFAEVARGIVTFAADVLWNEELGGFGGSQDADVGPGDDGDFFTWTPAEARAALSEDEWAVAMHRFDIGEQGEMHHNPAKNVLWIARTVEQLAGGFGASEAEVRAVLARIREKLLAARLRRPAPFVDPTVYLSWNGMMIRGLAEAARFVREPRAQALAVRCADRLAAQCWNVERGWPHALGPGGTFTGGFLDDQAQMALGLLTLYQLTGEPRHLELGLGTIRVMEARFRTPNGAFRDTPIDQRAEVAALAAPSHPYADQPTPAPVPTAAIALEVASLLTGEPAYHARAEEVMRQFAGENPRRIGHMGSTAALALAMLVWPNPTIVLTGDAADPRHTALRDAALRAWRPGLVVRHGRPGTHDGTYLPSPDGAPRAFICAGGTCSPPVSEAASLVEALRSLARP
ncbi:MAG: thioredoxin domain-containing protein [Candidatus Sumerlaeia bacterium]|nr:thioredoxin domain-containing protein [Candidatus Sumerlaeia bacterium]